MKSLRVMKLCRWAKLKLLSVESIDVNIGKIKSNIDIDRKGYMMTGKRISSLFNSFSSSANLELN